MGVVTVSSSASRHPVGLATRSPTRCSPLRRTSFVAFKTDKSKNASLVTPQDSVPLPIDTPTENRKSLTRATKLSKRVKVISTDDTSSCTIDLDYNEAAAALENIYKLSPAVVSDVEDSDHVVQRRRRTRKRKGEDYEKGEKETSNVVRNRTKKMQRLSLDKRIALRRKKVEEGIVLRKKKTERVFCSNQGGVDGEMGGGYVKRLIREYSVSTDLVSLDWKKMKIPPVLPSSEHSLLFKLMQPMKALFLVKENLTKNFGREPTDGELAAAAAAANMGVIQVRRHLEVGRAARNKLIKHNLRLVLFVINKYYQELASGQKFNDLCQAGAKGLIIAIDRFEPKRSLRLSTYGLFWIRHAIMRSLTLSSFTRVSFGIESVRVEIQRAKLELLFELERLPTEDEIIARVGISPARYQDVMKASKPIYSLHARHTTTQEEFIKGIADIDGVGRDKRRQPTLLRLALDDVLDSLKPKESLVIRQRYGLDGKGNRTLGEIGGNLNISREMVRKYEVKALMKLKHPTRVDYLRRYVV